MARIHNLGFPRIGAQRELKFALEAFWRGEQSAADLEATAAELRRRHWQQQAGLDWVPVGDFSLYDQVLDMSFTLGNVPQRVRQPGGSELDDYFRLARGRSRADACEGGVQAGELTKWFDTNYHYIVPELNADTSFSLHAERLLSQLAEARDQQVPARPVLIGPVSYLALGKSRDDTDPLTLLEPLVEVYAQLLDQLAAAGVEWVQVDEPALVTDLAAPWQQALAQAYERLSASPVKLLLTTYFGDLRDHLELVGRLPVAGIHLDATRASHELPHLLRQLGPDQVLSLGVIDGRNIWKTDLTAVLDRLEPLAAELGDRLWLAPSCSLLHVPVDLAQETELDEEIRPWLAFALQKLDELRLLQRALNQGRESVAAELAENQAALTSRRQSARVHRPDVQQAVAALEPKLGQRNRPYAQRARQQAERLPLPRFPTTTIGSFPQTDAVRQARRQHRDGEIDEAAYRAAMKAEIRHCIEQQEKLGLDVLVHGEAERNDMVEYFGEQLEGYVFTRHGWVQSYGSRCVKPPILYGDVRRPQAMTVDWIRYAQSLTDKPVKGMLTGPVTLLNWSFVRDDQPLSATCYQLALAIRQEVQDLEQAGVHIIQIDEAALREGLPLRRSCWQDYLDWAIESFRIAANGVADATQIHTHMCYSDFNDIIEAIAAMDADVITIETSRSDKELLEAFEEFHYPNSIGPGVYDIHSPNTPQQEDIRRLLEQSARHLPAERLWVNPDCGLKTRRWEEVLPALENLVAAARELRQAS